MRQITKSIRARSNPAGFTLIEMLIVVSIIAIAAALVVPMLGDTSASKLRGAAGMLVADVSFAQIETVAHGDDKRMMVFDNENDRYHIAAESDTTMPITNPINGQAYLIDYGTGTTTSLEGVTINGYSLNGDNLLGFDVYGGLDQATDATITLGCEGASITITIDAETGEGMIGAIN